MRIWRLVVTAITFGGVFPAFAGDPTGLWLTEDGEAKVQIYSCGDALCGRLAWLKEPNDPETGQPKVDKFNKNTVERGRPVFGLVMISELKPNGKPDQWEGALYNPEDGNTYKGTLALQNPLNLKLQGCALVVFCRSEMWKRTN